MVLTGKGQSQMPSSLLCVANLASYASFPEATRGRRHIEHRDTKRNPFQRDRNRIIHCNSFRRFEYKTQVFVNYEGVLY